MKLLVIFIFASCFTLQIMAGSSTYPPSGKSCVLCIDVYRIYEYPSTLDCIANGSKKSFIEIAYISEIGIQAYTGACMALDVDDLKKYGAAIPAEVSSVSIYNDSEFKNLEIHVPA